MTDNIFTWGIGTLERRTSDGIVTAIHWTCDCTSDDGVYRQGAYGSIGLDEPDPIEDAIPYADLTREQCIQWVQNKLGEETVQRTVDALNTAIAEMRAPSKAAGVPWS